MKNDFVYQQSSIFVYGLIFFLSFFHMRIEYVNFVVMQAFYYTSMCHTLLDEHVLHRPGIFVRMNTFNFKSFRCQFENKMKSQQMFWSTTKFDAKNEPFIFLRKEKERKNMQFFNISVQSRMLSVVVYSIIVVERNGCSTKHTRKHECAHNLYAHAK